MHLENVISELGRRALVTIDRETLQDLLAAAEAILEDDTCVAGWIRILAAGDLVLVQEETPDREILLRRMPSLKDARRFVEHRLEIYERMWNGCGCSIDYLDVSSST